MGNYFSSHYQNITYPLDSERKNGLRNAQIGAIHSLAAFNTLSNKQAAIIVMPTGAGKTAVLMLTPYLILKNKVLVVTPSIMVRGQIVDDFRELTTLCKANVFKQTMKKPIVFEMESKFKEDMIPELENADVIVATPQCALSLSETEWAVKKIELVEIDEAHHTPAVTWQQILINLNMATHVLFTATPFRLDKKEIKGDIVYDYPLSLAYRDGIFGEISFIPVPEGDDKDVKIAKKAEEVLVSDRDEGLNHFLMVRTDTKKNAEALEQLYTEQTNLKLRRIDSSMSNKKVKQCITELKDQNIDGIISVDMLGEGFDFPNLKIAAVHSPHKSLASTLQFIGRFARTNATNIGTAKFIAANDEELEIENQRLYARDAVWQEIIINMSEGKNQKEVDERKYYKTYEYADSEFDEGKISLQSISLNCHAKIYRANGFKLQSEFPESLNVGNRVYRSKEDNTVVGIGLNYVSPLWMTNEYRINKEYSLYLIHYQQSTGLLYIYSQLHTEAIYECLADTFCESYDKIAKSEINRVLGNLNGFEIFNSGMVNRFNESGEAYRIMAGSDVSDSIDPSTGKMYSAGHVFCKAIDSRNGSEERITIGYSSASKVWSSEYKSIPDYIEWAERNGEKIINSDIIVKTNTNYDFIPQAVRLLEYPNNIFFADYSDITYTNPPTIKSKSNPEFAMRLTDFSLEITKCKKNQIAFRLFSVDHNYGEEFYCDVDGCYESKRSELYFSDGTQDIMLEDYFDNVPISFKTLDDAIISGFEIYKGVSDIVSFDQTQIIDIDWDALNTDVGTEFGIPNNGKISIQDALKSLLMKNVNYKYIIYDHGSGEIADFISVQETNNQMIVRLYHVKKKTGVGYNNNTNDVYEVAGQAVKSISWLTTKGKFSNKIFSRRSSGHCKMIKGDFAEFIKKLRDPMYRLTAFIDIVQPSLSKTVPMQDKIQEVLASASSYISRAGKVKGLEIIGSK